MIPKPRGIYGYLPAGEHPASWAEVVSEFGKFAHRKRLLDGLLEMCRALRAAGATVLFLDGSFVTKKPLPGDFDACYLEREVDVEKLDPVLRDCVSPRAAMKAKYKGEAFPAEAVAVGWEPYRSFFQHDREGRPKGIVVLDLASVP